jgi:small-conductance mechanosensitive channel
MDSLSFLLTERGLDILRASLILLFGFALAKLAAAGVRRLAVSHLKPQHGSLLRRLVFYGILLLALMSAMHQLGFSLTVILGAAGILSVALGFASQTSASNLISGLFLIGEEAFSVGDVIKIGETVGEVLSIDLLSVKLRTFDNLYVRVPNETLIRTEITNLSRFAIRRLDLKVGVAYHEDLKRVREVLIRVADNYPLSLTEPKPLVLFLGFGDSALELQFSVWAARENFLELRNRIPELVKEAFDDAGIEIPFPHRSLYAGSQSDPFPVRIVGEAGSGQVPPESRP